MTGNEHFMEAQQAIEASTYSYQKWGEGNLDADDRYRAATWEMRRAQAHAMLALAWAFNRAQTDAHGLQQYMAERILERDEERAL